VVAPKHSATAILMISPLLPTFIIVLLFCNPQ
jgi:hypothetical protein